MPRIALTDLTIRTLKSTPKQTQYWDASLPSFGVRINPRGTKTFNVMIGKDRRLIKIGNYPTMTLGVARRRAHELIDEQLPSSISFPAARALFVAKHVATLKPSSACAYDYVMRRFPFTTSVASLTLDDVTKYLSGLPRGSARHSFNVLRTFFNWCIVNDYLKHSPLKKSPYKPNPRDRLLSHEHIAMIWREAGRHYPFGEILRVLILTGQRLNQIASMREEWLHQSLSTQQTALVFPAHIMKSNARHTIPLTPLARKHLVYFPNHSRT